MFFFIISKLIVIDIKFKNNKKRVPTNLVIKVKIGDLNKNLCVLSDFGNKR